VRPAQNRAWKGMRIFVTENSAPQALDLLEEAGAKVVGPAKTVAEIAETIMECPWTGPCLAREYCLPKTTLSNFSVFRERMAEACRMRGMTESKLCSEIGMGDRRVLELHAAGTQAIDIYRLGQIGDCLNVSLDWLLGRSDAMELPRQKNKPAKESSVQAAVGLLSSAFQYVLPSRPKLT
jgi:hypothetical protein